MAITESPNSYSGGSLDNIADKKAESSILVLWL